MDTLSRVLADAVEAGPNVFVRTTPEVLDFTDPDAKCELTVYGSGGNVATVTLTPQNIYSTAATLKVSVFAKGMKIIGWNWKALATYFLAKTGKEYSVEGTIIDLKVIESFGGVGKPGDQKAPASLAEALNRLKSLVQTGIWKEVQPVYNKVHLPLITQVIPALEANGLLDLEAGKKVHAYYEVCGQANGRLGSSLEFRDGFHPHGLSDTVKKKLKPRGLDELFMYFDFKNMEVTMLDWLSKDERLAEAMKADDVYTEIYKLVTGMEPKEKDDRNKAKKMFLPVIYGQSAHALGHRLKIALPTAEKIVNRIRTLFPAAIAYVKSYQDQAQATGYGKDIFGKRRLFQEDHEALNFSVQAPASTVCLEKLVRLHSALKGIADLAYSVHDGYCVFAAKDNWKRVFRVGYDALTSESSLCPGLRLKVACHAGRNLDSLKPLQTAKGA